MALRLIQGEPCPRRRAAATRERHERTAASDPHDVRFWLRERSAGAVGDPSSEGARSLLARAEAEHIEEEARKAARVAREGKEERLVQCRWQAQEEARKAARIAREGKEERLVQCRWQAQGEREVLVRLDTGELIDSRVAERQGKLFGGSDDKAVN